MDPNKYDYRPEVLFNEPNKNRTRRPYIDVGEFLPPQAKGFMEIARISLASTTGDVISIRAKKTKKGYEIKVEDEYESNYDFYQKLFKLIPTQGEVFKIITSLNEDSVDMIMNLIEYGDYKSIEEFTSFIHIKSSFYPDLNEMLEEYLKDFEF